SLGSVAVTSGTASFATTLLPGEHDITAVYSGDADFTTSTSAHAAVAVSQGSTSTTLSSSALSAVFGQAVTFTAAVSPAVSGPVDHAHRERLSFRPRRRHARRHRHLHGRLRVPWHGCSQRNHRQPDHRRPRHRQPQPQRRL